MRFNLNQLSCYDWGQMMRNPSKFQYSDTNPRNNPTFPTNLQFLHPCRIIKLHHAIHSQRLY